MGCMSCMGLAPSSEVRVQRYKVRGSPLAFLMDTPLLPPSSGLYSRLRSRVIFCHLLPTKFHVRCSLVRTSALNACTFLVPAPGP